MNKERIEGYFMDFLNEHGIYEKLYVRIEDCETLVIIKSFDELLDKKDSSEWLTHGFEWKTTKEGIEFWCKYAILWHKRDNKLRKM